MSEQQFGYKLSMTEDMRSALMRAVVHRQERVEEMLKIVSSDQWRKSLEDERAGLEKSLELLLRADLVKI
ncbi:hypothetical protein [Paenibacillus daejeonensis]|uniref:hypothetical protein n=1 Tax=Paenibacillus daejeonensis TaxID=135193 RepID=UPI000366A511|nr:hypothetical protein [Paenibacillus daejeonensis]